MDIDGDQVHDQVFDEWLQPRELPSQDVTNRQTCPCPYAIPFSVLRAESVYGHGHGTGTGTRTTQTRHLETRLPGPDHIARFHP